MGTSEKNVLDCELKNRKKFRGYWFFLILILNQPFL
jgi:hypothetical protein